MTPSASMMNARRSWPTARAILALILREMGTQYGTSPGGYLWAVLEPVLALVLMSAMFAMFFDRPPLGTNFALFYASGYLPFMMYAGISGKIGTAIRYSKPLLAYPGVTFVDAMLARFLLNALTEVVVFVLLVHGIILAFGLHENLDYLRILLATAMAFSLAAGVGTLNCYLCSSFPVWERVWSILNRPLFMMSGVFFLFDGVPGPFRDLLWFNPLVHVIDEMRAGIFATHDARFTSPLYVFAVSIVTLFLGMLLLRRHHRSILNEGA